MQIIPQEFIDKYSDAIIAATQGTGLFPSVAMAQLALETGWGKSIADGNNNLFGIKASGKTSPYWNGDSANLDTEEDNGGAHQENDAFRVYQSEKDSISDHTYFLQTNQRYADVFNASGPGEQAQALQDAGYSTNPDYAVILVQIMNAHHLYDLDKKKIS